MVNALLTAARTCSSENLDSSSNQSSTQPAQSPPSPSRVVQSLPYLLANLANKRLTKSLSTEWVICITVLVIRITSFLRFHIVVERITGFLVTGWFCRLAGVVFNVALNP